MNRPDVDAALFDADGVAVSAADFQRGLAALGVARGDVVFAHSDLATFGKLVIEDRECLMELICSALMSAVGEEGTLLMPTFTYSFCKSEVFDVDRTKSTVGALTEHFRRRPGVVRTQHPIFSAAIWGRAKAEYLNIGRDSFDENSIFAKLRRHQAKILFVGVPFRLACTYVHYIEQSYGVPYRYLKTFSGTLRTSAGDTAKWCTYYVRHLDQNVNTDLSRFEQRLLQLGVLRRTQVGAGHVWVAGAEELYEEGRRLLAENVRGFLEGEGPHAVSVLPQ